jgi:hypothetical protein
MGLVVFETVIGGEGLEPVGRRSARRYALAEGVLISEL